MQKTWQARYFDGRRPISHSASIRVHPNGVHVHFADGRSSHWQKGTFEFQQERVTGPARLVRGSFSAEILEIDSPEFSDAFFHANQRSGSGIRKPSAHMRFLALTAGLLLLAVILGSKFQWGIPWATGWLVKLVPVSLEEELGDAVVEKLLPNREPCQQSSGVEGLASLVTRIRPQNSQYHFQVQIIRSPLKNAVAFPGGKIFVFEGMLPYFPTPEALAGVLAHEMQHIELHHGTRNLISHLAMSGLFSLVSGDSGMLSESLIAGAKTLSMLHYSRRFETEADMAALEQLHLRNVDLEKSLNVFRELVELKGRMKSFLPQYLSTHPELSSRLSRLEKHISSLPTGRSQPVLPSQSWDALKKICG